MYIDGDKCHTSFIMYIDGDKCQKENLISVEITYDVQYSDEQCPRFQRETPATRR